jgi:3-hydroxyisobutyrate dehydrogenase
MNTAFLGLGAIGRPMAARIAAAGHALAVWNRTSGRAAEFVKQNNARQAQTPADAVRDADVIVTCFSTSPDVYSILDGDDGLLAGVKRGSVVVDCTSGDPTTSKRIAEGRAVRGAG